MYIYAMNKITLYVRHFTKYAQKEEWPIYSRLTDYSNHPDRLFWHIHSHKYYAQLLVYKICARNVTLHASSI
jgi:hypothetical protein